MATATTSDLFLAILARRMGRALCETHHPPHVLSPLAEMRGMIGDTGCPVRRDGYRKCSTHPTALSHRPGMTEMESAGLILGPHPEEPRSGVSKDGNAVLFSILRDARRARSSG